MVKRLNALLLIMIYIITSLFISGDYRIYANEQESHENNNLSFSLTREWMRDVEPIPQSTYYNYWAFQPDNEVYDKAKGEMRDFTVKYKLHVEGESETRVGSMHYTAKDYKWHGTAKFENIRIPEDKVEVEYYTLNGSKFMAPYLLEYDLYLKKSGDKMILSIPRLSPKSGYPNPTGVEKVLEVKNIKIQKINSVIYLDGENGNDNNDGLSKDKAVKTFSKAKELAQSNKVIEKIEVIGTVSLAGDISLEGTNAEIVRGEDFSGLLFSVDKGKTATLSNITIDGVSNYNKNIEKSLIRVNAKSTLNIDDGTVLKNNKIKPIQNTMTIGGGGSGS